jgi:hypothetical protein
MLWAVIVGLLYGGFSRWAFGSEDLKLVLGLVTLAFVFLVPLAFGAVVVLVGSKDPRWSWRKSVGMPVLVVLLCLVAVMLLQMESLVCILMAAPVMMFMAILGGLSTQEIIRGRQARARRNGRMYVTALVLLPYLVAPLENRFTLPQAIRTTDTQIVIDAPPEKVWANIARVRAISSSELQSLPVYWMGFPRPIEATLSHDGVGGVRHATFERHVLFIETVTRWDEPRLLSFTIHADGDFIPPASFDRHVTVGGQFFDVLDGTYEIERLGPERVILHLSSNHRLSTRFNWYSGLWSNWIMAQIQNSILHVIKERCEAKG